MAWGCFCWIPCPYKKWREEDRPAMLAMLPLVGTFIGLITGLAWWCMGLLGAAPILTAAVVTALYFLLTGFIHLDGYMDCCDAILPRHPDKARRVEILKDPHTGAFGVIGVVLMMAVFLGAAADLSASSPIKAMIVFAIICTVSRMDSVVSVLVRKPMETSQYVQLDPKKNKVYVGVAIAIAILVFIAGDWLMKMLELSELLAPLIGALVVLAVCEIVGAYDRRALGGMNGDISGHMIVTGEMFGLLAAALIM